MPVMVASYAGLGVRKEDHEFRALPCLRKKRQRNRKIEPRMGLRYVSDFYTFPLWLHTG